MHKQSAAGTSYEAWRKEKEAEIAKVTATRKYIDGAWKAAYARREQKRHLQDQKLRRAQQRRDALRSEYNRKYAPGVKEHQESRADSVSISISVEIGKLISS